MFYIKHYHNVINIYLITFIVTSNSVPPAETENETETQSVRHV